MALYKLSVYIFYVFFLMNSFSAQSQKATKVKIYVVDETGEILPAMACITYLNDGLPRVPPNAEIPTSQDMHMTQKIYRSGVNFDDSPDWIGPVRMMSGQGDNDDRSYVYELLPSLPYWREPVMYQTSGHFSIHLPSGRWRISLEHGNEYIPISEEFTITSKEAEITKYFEFKRWINLPKRGWYSGDVHVHHPTTKPKFKEYIMQYAKAEDLHLVNLLTQGTDHALEGAPQEGFGKEFRLCRDDICLVSGQEDPSSRFGHIIGLNIDHLVRDTSVYNYYDIVFKELHQQPGALVGFAHFSWNGCDLPKGFPWLVTTDEIDFVELLQFSKINTLDYYDYLNLGFRISAAAGSDFPWGSTIGEVRTFVYTGPDFSADNWFDGLRSGHSFVTNGPALFLEADGQLPGTELVSTAGSSTHLTVKVLSNPSIGTISRLAIYNNDGLVTERLNPSKADSLEIVLSYEVKCSQWLAAIVNCDNGAVAHTTPIYLVVDGQPTWSKSKAPGIIENQLIALDNIEDEEKNRIITDEGILKRINDARTFYSELLRQIKSDGK